MSYSDLPIRLVALDLDGTLLNHHSAITPRTREAVAAAAARGVVIVPATGRPLASLPPVVAQLPGVRYVITSNGAAVWDLGQRPLAAVYSRYANADERDTAEPRCLIRRLLPVQTARQAFGLYQQYEGALNVFSDGRAIRDADSMARSMERLARLSTEAAQPNDGRFTIVPWVDEWMARNAHTVEKFCMFFSSAEQAQAALPAFLSMPGVEVVQGAPDNIEVTAAGVDKGEALLQLAEQLGIPQQQTLAVGDSENDRAMLEKAGMAAVMANGMPHIRALADIVSVQDCDHDGVAELFERLKI
ncbi:MAG: HAD-IIB family hydrolase [Faecalibacterium sp.]